MYEIIKYLTPFLGVALALGLWTAVSRARQYAAELRLMKVRVANAESGERAAKAVSQVSERKRLEVIGMVDGILNERDEWKTLYVRHASEHGAAQSMLMRERDNLMRQLKSAGRKAKTDPVIDAVVGKFEQEHVAPYAEAVKGGDDAILALKPPSRIDVGKDEPRA